jgi:hypothetical protein
MDIYRGYILGVVLRSNCSIQLYVSVSPLLYAPIKLLVLCPSLAVPASVSLPESSPLFSVVGSTAFRSCRHSTLWPLAVLLLKAPKFDSAWKPDCSVLSGLVVMAWQRQLGRVLQGLELTREVRS